MCNIVRHGCQIQILPYKSHALGDCFKNQMIAKQTVRIDLCFPSIQQSDETLAMLYEISPTVTVKRGEKCRRNKDLSKFLEMEIPLFKVLIFCFTLALFTLGRYCARRKTFFHFESSFPQRGSLQDSEIYPLLPVAYGHRRFLSFLANTALNTAPPPEVRLHASITTFWGAALGCLL